MRVEFTVLGLLAIASFYYVKKVDNATRATRDLFKSSVEMVQYHEDRLVRVEEAVAEVPEMRDDIKEIKRILLASGFKMTEDR